MSGVLNGIDGKLADQLFNIGAIQFGAFKLKLHEKNPDAPLSPIYINLRTPDNPKPGPLTPEIIKAVGKYLYAMAYDLKLIFQHVAGIPRAGEPLAEAFSQFSSTSLLKLKKEETAEGRRVGEICDGSYKKRDIVLLIDDLVTAAESKIEAIRSLEACGLKVRDVLVLIDREQGGKKELEKAGYNLHTGFTLSKLLRYYRITDRITLKKEKEVLNYLANN